MTLMNYESDVYADNFVRCDVVGVEALSQAVLVKYFVLNSQNKQTAVSYGTAGSVASA
jgi:hypothetical protein